MVVSWMLYALVVGLFLAVAAGSLERALRLGGRPGRWVWAGAVGAALVLPVVSMILSGRGAAPSSPALGPVTPVAAPVTMALGGITRGIEAATAPVLGRLEAPILRLWALASLALLALLGGSVLRLRSFRRRWAEQIVDGERVLVSDTVGPAVLGLLRHRIVVPQWLVERGAEARGLILEHEREHCRARDPLLVFVAALPAVLLPWNLTLWWCLRRLRVAIEMDCDERVVRAASPGVRRRYGQLLVEVGRRPLGGPRALPAFSEGRSALEQRIRALTDRLPVDRRRRMATLAGVGALLVGAACVVPGPDSTSEALAPEETAVSPSDLSESPVFTPYTVAPEVTNRTEVQRALVREYPPLLRDAGIGGTVNVWFFIDETGEVVRTRLVRSSGRPELDAAALHVAGVMHFTPAFKRDDPVAVWVQMPIRFEVRSGAGAAAESVTGRVRTEEAPLPPGVEVPPTIEIPPTPEELRSGRASPRRAPSDAVLRDGPAFTPYTVAPEITNRAEVQRALVREYPPLLRDAGIGGTVNVWFFIDAGGQVRDTRLVASSGHGELDDAALRVAEAMSFSPALNRDRAVPVWVQMPIKFEVR